MKIVVDFFGRDRPVQQITTPVVQEFLGWLRAHGDRRHKDPKTGQLSGDGCSNQTDYKDNVLYLNPGSIGPRRYKIPVALTLAACASDRWNAPLGSRVSANLIPLRSRPLLTGP